MSEDKMVVDVVKSIISDNLGVEEIKLEDSLVNDLAADSLDAIEIIMALEEEFNIEIADEDAEELEKVSDIVEYIEERLEEASKDEE